MSPVPTVEASPGWRGVATVCRYRPGARQWTVAQLGAADTDTADTSDNTADTDTADTSDNTAD